MGFQQVYKVIIVRYRSISQEEGCVNRLESSVYECAEFWRKPQIILKL